MLKTYSVCVCNTFSKIKDSKDLETQSGKIVEHLIEAVSPLLYYSFTTEFLFLAPPEAECR